MHKTQFSCGLFFGNKEHSRKIRKVHFGAEEKSADLFSKMENLFKSFANVKIVHPIDDDLIKIVDLGNGDIRADVICIFCESNDTEIEALLKRYAVQYDKSGWNLSNFRKHIIKQHVKKNPINNDSDHNIESSYTPNTPNRKENNTNLLKSPCVSNDIMELPIVFEDGATEKNTDEVPNDLKTEILRQIGKQSLRLIESSLVHNEPKKFMTTNIDGRMMNINVLNMKQIGNCLFEALIHQRECMKSGSREHDNAAAELRKEIVKNIEENLEQYKMAIKGRIDPNCKNIDEECKKFVIEKLSQNTFYGGAETCLAFSNIYKANILVFNEKGPFYFATGFNPNFNQTFFLAYRSLNCDDNGKPIYNHYDSICGIEEEILYKCANYFVNKFSK